MQRNSANQKDEYDLIIVGGGLGGCIVAARIAQFGVNPRNGEKLRVAVLEFGPYFKGDSKPGYGSPEHRGAFANMPYDDARFSLPWGGGEAQGMVGGSAVHAGLIAHPPIPIDFEHWRAETGVDWSWEKFNLPLAEVYEMFHPYPEPEQIRTVGQERFKKVSLQLGYEVVEIAQAKRNCVRCGDCNGILCKYDAKSSTLVNYVPIAEREGVQFIPQAEVEKIVFEKKGSRPVATGVVYRQNGETHQARADKVIVSCGASGTPRLLFRSGYGPRNKVKGDLIAENRNVGANVCTSLRPGNIRALFDEPIKHEDIGVHGAYGVEKVYGPRGYHHLLIAENLGDKGGSRTFPQDLALSSMSPPFGRELKQYMKIAATNEGGVRFELSKNKLRCEFNSDGVPVIGEGTPERSQNTVTRKYLEKHHPEVLEPLREGIEMAKKIIQEMGPPKKMEGAVGIPDEMGGGNWISSCRAGASPDNSVVNSDFESHDIDNLFIADGSVLPYQCRWNPSMPIASVCNYAWRRIVAKHFSRA